MSIDDDNDDGEQQVLVASGGGDHGADPPKGAASGGKAPGKDTRFPPGVSGNPRGRPIGSVSLKTKLKRELQKKTIVKTPGGKTVRMAKGDVIVNQLVDKAMRDVKAAAMVWRWVDDEPLESAAGAGAPAINTSIPKLDREMLRRILNRAQRLEEDAAEDSNGEE